VKLTTHLRLVPRSRMCGGVRRCIEKFQNWPPGTYLFTPWCRILFEKLAFTQLVRKYSAFLLNPKVHYRVHTSPPLDHILSQLNSVHPMDPFLPKVHLNVILPPTPRSSQWLLDRAKESVQVRDALTHFITIKNIYGEGLSAPLPTPTLEDHPLSAVRDCLFNIFAVTLRTRRTSLYPQP
jgi:hypothetical protein